MYLFNVNDLFLERKWQFIVVNFMQKLCKFQDCKYHLTSVNLIFIQMSKMRKLFLFQVVVRTLLIILAFISCNLYWMAVPQTVIP